MLLYELAGHIVNVPWLPCMEGFIEASLLNELRSKSDCGELTNRRAGLPTSRQLPLLKLRLKPHHASLSPSKR